MKRKKEQICPGRKHGSGFDEGGQGKASPPMERPVLDSVCLACEIRDVFSAPAKASGGAHAGAQTHDRHSAIDTVSEHFAIEMLHGAGQGGTHLRFLHPQSASPERLRAPTLLSDIAANRLRRQAPAPDVKTAGRNPGLAGRWFQSQNALGLFRPELHLKPCRAEHGRREQAGIALSAIAIHELNTLRSIHAALEGPVAHFKCHQGPHGRKGFSDLLFLVRGKYEFKQSPARIDDGKESKIVVSFQQVTKKTRVAGSNADQGKCGIMRGRQADGLVSALGAGDACAGSEHATSCGR